MPRITIPRNVYDVVVVGENGNYIAYDRKGNIICKNSPTACIQESIDYLGSADFMRYIYILGGVGITSTINIPEYITIVGGKIGVDAPVDAFVLGNNNAIIGTRLVGNYIGNNGIVINGNLNKIINVEVGFFNGIGIYMKSGYDNILTGVFTRANKAYELVIDPDSSSNAISNSVFFGDNNNNPDYTTIKINGPVNKFNNIHVANNRDDIKCIVIPQDGKASVIANSEIENCESGIHVFADSVVISSSQIYFHRKAGIYLGGGSLISVSNCSFWDNSWGVPGYSDIIIEGAILVSLLGNTHYGYRYKSTSPVAARAVHEASGGPTLVEDIVKKSGYSETDVVVLTNVNSINRSLIY
jgi:hypothetical protein